jgi:hypothetical protein
MEFSTLGIDSEFAPENCRYDWNNPVTSHNINEAIQTCEFWQVSSMPLILLKSYKLITTYEIMNPTIQKLHMLKRILDEEECVPEIMHSYNLDCLTFIKETVNTRHSRNMLNQSMIEADYILPHSLMNLKELKIAAKFGSINYMTKDA